MFFLNYRPKSFIVLCFVFAFLLTGSAQETIRERYFVKGKIDRLDTTMRLNGYLSTENTTKQEWRDRFTGYEPLKSIRITNNSENPLIHPRWVVNGKNFYQEGAFIPQLVKNAKTLKDTILSVYTFVENHTLGRMHPDWEAIMDKYKAMFVYGYAPCDAFAWNQAFIFQYLNISMVDILMTHHHTVEAVIDTNAFLLDANEQAFYMNYNNEDLVSSKTVENDKFLIWRTKHLGVGEYTNRSNFTAAVYNNITKPPFVKKQDYSLDFILRPNEQIVYDYSTATLFHELNQHGWGTTLDMVKDVISNSHYIHSQNYIQENLRGILDDTLNITVGGGSGRPNLHARDAKKPSFYTVKFRLPFPVLNGDINLKLHQATLEDSILVYYSSDSVNWETVYCSNDVGVFMDSINLYNQIAPLVKRALYQYYLKVEFRPKDSAWACGIDSLYVNTTFQCSRFFLPQLKLGENTLCYSDSNGEDSTRNVEISIEWRESWENKPPNKVEAPIFPRCNDVVDSLYFGFSWKDATDDDGDLITDYEFMLCPDARMLFPLSPNFHLYVSAFKETQLRPYFKVKETGWLNSGETYYWRVRAKDERGAWSEWSDTWEFTPYGVMRPLNGKIKIQNQSLLLSWEPNTSGTRPDFYKIYASDESNGFYPMDATFWKTCDTTYLDIPFEAYAAPKSFYRIAACDSTGQESLVSDVLAAPYPYLYGAVDSLTLGKEFRFELLSNERYYPYFQSVYCTTEYIPQIKPLSLPSWLTYDGCSLLCRDTAMARKILFMDDSVRRLCVELNDYRQGLDTICLEISSTERNRKPLLKMRDILACESVDYFTYIYSTEGDVRYGDRNRYLVVKKPSWLRVLTLGDSLYLTGVPAPSDSISTIDILAIDSYNDSAYFSFPLLVVPSLKLESISTMEAVEDSAWESRLTFNRPTDSMVRIQWHQKPAWVSCFSAERILGTPRIHDLSDTLFDLTYVDRLCRTYTDTQFSISIRHVNHAPQIVNKGLPSAQEDSLYRYHLDVRDRDTLVEVQDLRYELRPSDTWLNLDSITGLLSGIPRRKNRLDTLFRVRVWDRYGAEDEQCYSIRIQFTETSVIPLLQANDNRYRLIYPSPKNVYLDAQIQNNTIFRYQILTVSGSVLYRSQNYSLSQGAHQISLNMQNYASGIYILQYWDRHRPSALLKILWQNQ